MPESANRLRRFKSQVVAHATATRIVTCTATAARMFATAAARTQASAVVKAAVTRRDGADTIELCARPLCKRPELTFPDYVAFAPERQLHYTPTHDALRSLTAKGAMGPAASGCAWEARSRALARVKCEVPGVGLLCSQGNQLR